MSGSGSVEERGDPSGWVRDEFIRRWLWHETADHQVRFDAGFLVSNNHLRYEHEKLLPVSVYTPLFVPQMAMGAVVMGTLYGGRAQLATMFPLETEIRSRFCLDFRARRVMVYISHYAEGSGLLELMQLDTDTVGDIIARFAVFEIDNPNAVHFGFKTIEQKVCAFCAARGMLCECIERMRRSSLPDLPDVLRQEYGAVSHTTDLGVKARVAASIMQSTVNGKYRADVMFTARKMPNDHFAKRYDIDYQSGLVEQARIRYAQALVAGRRPRAILSLVSDGSPATSEGDSGSPAPEPDDGLSCALCGSRFTRKSDARRHARTVHLRERHFSCPTCSRKFIHKTHLREHIDAVHRKVAAAACPECGKMFTSKSKANRHLATVHKNLKLRAGDAYGHSYLLDAGP